MKTGLVFLGRIFAAPAPALSSAAWVGLSFLTGARPRFEPLNRCRRASLAPAAAPVRRPLGGGIFGGAACKAGGMGQALGPGIGALVSPASALLTAEKMRRLHARRPELRSPPRGEARRTAADAWGPIPSLGSARLGGCLHRPKRAVGEAHGRRPRSSPFDSAPQRRLGRPAWKAAPTHRNTHAGPNGRPRPANHLQPEEQ